MKIRTLPLKLAIAGTLAFSTVLPSVSMANIDNVLPQQNDTTVLNLSLNKGGPPKSTGCCHCIPKLKDMTKNTLTDGDIPILLARSPWTKSRGGGWFRR